MRGMVDGKTDCMSIKSSYLVYIERKVALLSLLSMQRIVRAHKYVLTVHA